MYLGQRRVEHAKKLLSSGVPISATAVTAGFSDQSHLTRHFKRVVGMTPGTYLRAYRWAESHGKRGFAGSRLLSRGV